MNRFCSILSQLLQLFSRVEFQKTVKENNAGRHARGFACWGESVSMFFCQLGRAYTLREITGGLRRWGGKLKQPGIEAPSRLSLAYVNAHRPWTLRQQILLHFLERVRQKSTRPNRFHFKNKLPSLDSTIIDLRSCASVSSLFRTSAPAA